MLAPMHNATALPAHVTLQPLRAFHIDHGQGRTVAVLFRVAVHQHGACANGANKQACNKQAAPRIKGVP